MCASTAVSPSTIYYEYSWCTAVSSTPAAVSCDTPACTSTSRQTNNVYLAGTMVQAVAGPRGVSFSKFFLRPST